MKKFVFIYDKDNCLDTYAELSSKNKLVRFYSVKGSELTKLNISKQKNKLQHKKTVISFTEDIKLCHMFIDEYGTRVSAIKRKSNRIETPKVKSRIETLNDEYLKGFTIKPSILNSWLDKL